MGLAQLADPCRLTAFGEMRTGFSAGMAIGRPVEPGTFPLAHGAAAGVGRLRGYGNALVAPQAKAFIKTLWNGWTYRDGRQINCPGIRNAQGAEGITSRCRVLSLLKICKGA